MVREITLAEIIKGIARRHGVPASYVGGFVLDSIEELLRSVDLGIGVKVRGLGTFRWQKVSARTGTGALKGFDQPEGWKLRFIPARRFRGRRKKMPDNEEMVKYGVELDAEKTKQASEGSSEEGRCPTCSRKLDNAGACPVHGTEPLEPTVPRRSQR